MAKDGHIRLLSIHVANKIAAGEVVERPASVVKELMENAIDSGATRIEVTVTAGGRKLIQVSDNGCGMGRDDALLSLERQATSKIRDVDDIERIASLGFRGEALPSIASVSRFTLATRRAAEESGTEIAVSGGSLHDVREAGLPPGTTIAVRDLFFNVPARRKFLRTYQTEQAHIRSVFTLHALAHPEIGLTFSSDGRELVRLPPGATLAERARDLFGGDFCAGLRPVDKITGEIRVYGFVGLPGQTRNDSSEQYIFINRRPATAPVIGYALREAYPPLEGNRRPIVLLFVDLPPEQVDVNVHPTKREVRFHKPANVRDTLIAAVSEALGARRDMAPLTPGAAPVPGAAPGASPAEERSHAALQDDAPPATLRHLVPEAAAPPAIRPFPYPAPTPLEPTPAAALLPEHAPPPDGDGLPLLPTSPAGNAPWRWFRVVGQISGRYLLLESDDGLVILDPRATRERVLYEKLMAASREGTATSQRLLLPESVKLPPADAARLRKCLAVMQAMGFGVEDFGNDHFIVESLPQLLGNISCRELLGNIAHDIENAGTRRGSEKWREEVVAKAASRALAGMDSELGEAAAEQLVHELAATRMPYTCPRGRPTMILTSLRELERKFGR